MLTIIDRGDFWEFKARCAELDLELVKARALGEKLTAKRNDIVNAFAAKYGLDPARVIHLDDEQYTARQQEA